VWIRFEWEVSPIHFLCRVILTTRLGRNIHSQLALTPMPDFPHSITAIALGQDHTLALTTGGYILSWGHNRFSQLGYPIEQPEQVTRGKEEVEVQVSPKRIVGMLKKEFVKGVAAGRMASACWTEDAL
jgi:alpha-tubulin suppressor-like RCC1 family protein